MPSSMPGRRGNDPGVYDRGGIPGPAAAAPAEPILQLTPDIDRYFLGPYLAYLGNPQKKLAIDEVSSC